MYNPVKAVYSWICKVWFTETKGRKKQIRTNRTISTVHTYINVCSLHLSTSSMNEWMNEWMYSIVKVWQLSCAT